MGEQLRNVLAASVLAIAPAAVEREMPKLPPAYVRSSDEKEDELSHRLQLPETSHRERQAAKIGHFSSRMAARNNQMGHRFRADTR